MKRDPSADDDEETAEWWWLFDPRRSLHARAVLVFGGGAVALTLLVSGMAGAFFRRQIGWQTGRSYEVLAYQVSDKLDRGIYERYREIQLLADLAPVRKPATPVAERRQLLETFQNACPDYAWIGFADRSGTVTFAAQGLLEGTKVDTRNWFRRGQAQPWAGDVHTQDELARLLPNPDGEVPRFLDVAAPVVDLNGQFMGVLGAQLNWSWARRVQLSVVPDAARREHLGVSIYAAGRECLLDSGGSGWSEPLDAPSIPGPREFRGSFWESGPGGAAFLTGYARSRGYREYRGLGWLVTVRQPAKDAFAPVQELQGSIKLWGFGLAGVFALWGWIFASRLTRRLRAVAASADRIRSGDILSVLPRFHGHDELARMSGALDDMVDDLRQRQEKLEADNAQLEARLRRQAGVQPAAATPPHTDDAGRGAEERTPPGGTLPQ